MIILIKKNIIYGNVTYLNGDKYNGEFENDKKHDNGFGIMTYSNKNTYTGQFKNDKFNGHGVFYFF